MGRRIRVGGTARPTIQISRELKDEYVEWLNGHPSKPQQQAATSQIIKFFLRSMPAELQQFVMGGFPPSMRHQYANALRKIADDLDSGSPLRQIEESGKSELAPKAPQQKEANARGKG